MDDVVEPGCSPTLRVLEKHLQEPSAWEYPEEIKAINAGNFRTVLPLAKLSHCLIVAGQKLTADERSAQNLIVYQHSVTVDSPSVWRELKKDQWRGLVTEPTDDKDLLKIEKSFLAQQRWQSSSLTVLIDEIAKIGIAGSGSSPSRYLPTNPAHPGTQLEFTVELERLENDPVEPSPEVPAEVFVSLCIQNWADEVVRQAIVPILMGFIDPSQENWEAYSSGGKSTTYSVLISESRLAQIIASTTIPTTLSPSRGLRRNAPATSHAHYVSRDPLVDAYVGGFELQGLCGCWFVPTKDHAAMPLCTDCERVFATLT